MAVVVSTRGIPDEARSEDMYGWALGGGNEELNEEEQLVADRWEGRRLRKQLTQHAEACREDQQRRGKRLL